MDVDDVWNRFKDSSADDKLVCIRAETLTPFSAIRGYLALAKAKLPKSQLAFDPDFKAYLDGMAHASEQMWFYIEGFLPPLPTNKDYQKEIDEVRNQYKNVDDEEKVLLIRAEAQGYLPQFRTYLERAKAKLPESQSSLDREFRLYIDGMAKAIEHIKFSIEAFARPKE